MSDDPKADELEALVTRLVAKKTRALQQQLDLVTDDLARSLQAQQRLRGELDMLTEELARQGRKIEGFAD